MVVYSKYVAVKELDALRDWAPLQGGANKTNSVDKLFAARFEGDEEPHFMYEGDLNIVGSPQSNFPKNLIVCGNLVVSGCPNLASIGEELVVKGDFVLKDCHSLKSVSENLAVYGNVILTGLPAIKSIHSRALFHGDLEISDCANLKRIRAHLSLSNLVLKAIPRLESMEGYVYVSENATLAPDTVQPDVKIDTVCVSGNLVFMSEQNLTLHGMLYVNGTVDTTRSECRLEVNGTAHVGDIAADEDNLPEFVDLSYIVKK